MFFLWIFTFLVLLTIYSWYPLQQLRFRRAGLKGPFPYPYVMNMLDIVRAGNAIDAWRAWYSAHGPVFSFFMGNRPCVMVVDADLAREVVVGRPTEFVDRGLNPLPCLAIGDYFEFERGGIVFAEGEYWKSLRAGFANYFLHSESLKFYFPIMEEAVKQMIETLEPNFVSQRFDGQTVELSQLMSSLTLEVIGTTALGVHLSEAKSMEKASETLQACKEYMLSTSPYLNLYLLMYGLLPFTAPVLRVLATYFPLGDTQRRGQAARNKVMELVKGMIREARAKEAEGKEGKRREGEGSSDGAALVPEPGSFIRKMIDVVDRRTGKKLSDVQLSAQAFAAILAGFETTAATLSFVLHLIAEHPDVAAKLRAEADSLGPGHVPTADELAHFQYTEATLNEALRLYPPAIAVGRGAVSDCQLGKWTIPKGTTVITFMWQIHRDERYWKEPLKFRPERFLEGEPSAAFAFYPFGGGLRMCPGAKFAMQEAKLALIRLMQRFEFEAPPGMGPLRVRQGITLMPRDGVILKVKKRAL